MRPHRMRVLVCGDRNWGRWDDLSDGANADARAELRHVLDSFHSMRPFSVLIEGEAPGADSLARDWATDRGIAVLPFPADWKRLKHAAGPIRNQQMLDEGNPDVVIAFHPGIRSSKGTRDMLRRAGKSRRNLFAESVKEIYLYPFSPLNSLEGII